MTRALAVGGRPAWLWLESKPSAGRTTTQRRNGRTPLVVSLIAWVWRRGWQHVSHGQVISDAHRRRCPSAGHRRQTIARSELIIRTSTPDLSLASAWPAD